MANLPIWAVLSIIPAAAVLTPVLGFSMAMVAGIVLGLLKEAGLPTLFALAAAGFSGFLLGRKSPICQRTGALVEMEPPLRGFATMARASTANVSPFPAPNSRLADPPRGRIKAD